MSSQPDGIAGLPPLYKRINWAALLVPPIGVIVLMLFAMYVVPYISRRLGYDRRKPDFTNSTAPYRYYQKAHGEETHCQGTIQPFTSDKSMYKVEPKLTREGSERHSIIAAEVTERWSLVQVQEAIERPPSTPTHKHVYRTTPSPTPRLTRMSLSTLAPVASQENIFF